MSEPKIPYPPSPPEVPDGLTDYAELFTRQQKRLLTGLFVFLIFYLAMMVLLGMVAVWCALTLSGKMPILKIVGLVLCGTSFLFLLKGFFKRHVINEEMYVEITEEEQPALFGFLHQLCDELGAPFPNRVFLDPEVTAECIFRTSFVNLFVEPKRDLLIGMGLVNCTNLSEFKAVLAHELGHYCDLGRTRNYCAVVQRVMFDLVEGEDFFDRFLAWCKNTSDGGKLRMATWPIVYPVSWILDAGHAILWVILKSIAIPSRAMAWEEEFHADLVAVSAAGSDAVSHSLLRCQFGMQCLNQAIDDLIPLAQDHELYSNDIYVQQDRAAAIVRWKQQQPDLGLPPVLPDPLAGEKLRVFPEDHEDYVENVPPMWREHPASVAREENAKEHFVPAVMDHRSPWILFEHAPELKEEMSYQFYQATFHIRKNTEFTDALKVQEYIDHEYPEVKPTRPQLHPEQLLDSGEMPIRVAADSVGLPPLESLVPTVNQPARAAVVAMSTPATPAPVPVPQAAPAAPVVTPSPVVIATPVAPAARATPTEIPDVAFTTMPAIPGMPTMAGREMPSPPPSIAQPTEPLANLSSIAPSMDELKGETVFDEVIKVVDPEAPEPVGAPLPPPAPDMFGEILQVPPTGSVLAAGSGILGAEPIAEATAVDSSVLEAALSEAVATDPISDQVRVVAEATPIAEGSPINATAFPQEPTPAAEPQPVPAADSLTAEPQNEVPPDYSESALTPEPEPEIPSDFEGLPFELADILMDPAAPSDGPLPDTLLDVKISLPLPSEEVPAATAVIPIAEIASGSDTSPTPNSEAPLVPPAELMVEAAPVAETEHVAEPMSEPEPAPRVELAPPLNSEIQETSSMSPEPEPTTPEAETTAFADAATAEAVPSAAAISSEDESALLPSARPPGAAAIETIPTAAQDTFVRTTPASPPPVVAFGSAAKSEQHPVSCDEDQESEVFVLDEVAPIPTESEGLVSLDPDSGNSGAGKSGMSSVPESRSGGEQRELGRQSTGTEPSSDVASKPFSKIVVPGRPAAPTATSKSGPSATPSTRPAFGSGSHPALVVCSISETTVAAEGRRPAIRITYVKPGEKSPIKK